MKGGPMESQGSVADVEWGDAEDEAWGDAQEGEEEEVEEHDDLEAPPGEEEAPHDLEAPPAKDGEFEAWMSKGEEGEDFGEGDEEELAGDAKEENKNATKKKKKEEEDKAVAQKEGGPEKVVKIDGEETAKVAEAETAKTEAADPDKEKAEPVPAAAEGDQAAAEGDQAAAEGDPAAAEGEPGDAALQPLESEGEELGTPPPEAADSPDKADLALGDAEEEVAVLEEGEVAVIDATTGKPETKAQRKTRMFSFEADSDDGRAAERKEEEKEMMRNLSFKGKIEMKLQKYKDKWDYWFDDKLEHHTNKMRCILIPLFCCCIPSFVCFIFFRIVKSICGGCCRDNQREEELEEEARAQEERMRIALALKDGPQRSTLKPASQFNRFGRDRAHANESHSPKGGKNHSPRQGRDALRSAANKEQELGAHLTHKRVKATGGVNVADEDGILKDTMGHVIEKEPLWRRLNPARYPAYIKEYCDWRRQYLRRVAAVLDTIEEEEEFDWDNIDEHGNPARRVFLIPPPVRRRYRFFMLVYWDPLLDLFDHLPLLIKGLKTFIRLLPCFALIGALTWFGISLWRNMQYVEGNCHVEKLPKSFDTIGLIDEQVEAVYTVLRRYEASPTRGKGILVQECTATVPCTQMDYGATNSYDDDRCVIFQAWKIGDPLSCFYKSDDFWGENGSELYCLDLPSRMERETFTVAIASVINLLICVILGVMKWHRNDLARQARLAAAEQDAAEREEAAAKKLIEENEAADALKQAEAVNRELGITEEDEDAADFVIEDAAVRADEGAEGMDAERTAMKDANTMVHKG